MSETKDVLRTDMGAHTDPTIRHTFWDHSELVQLTTELIRAAPYWSAHPELKEAFIALLLERQTLDS